MRFILVILLPVLLVFGGCKWNPAGMDGGCVQDTYIAGGDQQRAWSGSELELPLVLGLQWICESTAVPSMAGAMFRFDPLEFGGELIPDQTHCRAIDLSPDGVLPSNDLVACTDNRGHARARWILGENTVGWQDAVARLEAKHRTPLGYEYVRPVIFRAWAEAPFEIVPPAGPVPLSPNGQVTVTFGIVRSSAAGAVRLCVDGGLPGGVTAPTCEEAASNLPGQELPSITEQPAAVVTTTATLPFTAGPNAAIDQHAIVVRGEWNGYQATADFVLDIAVPAPLQPAIRLSLDPAELILHQGGEAETIVRVDRTGDVGVVSLTATDVPGVTTRFAPKQTGAGTSTLTLTASVNAASSPGPITVTGTWGDVTGRAELTLRILEPPDPERCVVFQVDSEWTEGWDDEYVPGRTSGTVIGYTVEERATGGNPDAYRYVTLSMGTNSGVWIQHRREGAVWAPATDGPVDRIVASLDVRAVPPERGEAISSFMLIQNETVYWTERVRVWDADGWVRASWTETEFVKFGAGPGPDRPDFSVAGGPIQFGYLTGGSHTTGAATATRHNGADNWRAEVCTGSS